MRARNRGHRRGGQNGRWRGWRGLGPEAPATGSRMPRKSQPMTAKQASFLEQLCEQAGEPFNPRWSKVQASERIDALKRQLRKVQGRPLASLSPQEISR